MKATLTPFLLALALAATAALHPSPALAAAGPTRSESEAALLAPPHAQTLSRDHPSAPSPSTVSHFETGTSPFQAILNPFAYGLLSAAGLLALIVRDRLRLRRLATLPADQAK